MFINVIGLVFFTIWLASATLVLVWCVWAISCILATLQAHQAHLGCLTDEAKPWDMTDRVSAIEWTMEEMRLGHELREKYLAMLREARAKGEAEARAAAGKKEKIACSGG